VAGCRSGSRAEHRRLASIGIYRLCGHRVGGGRSRLLSRGHGRRGTWLCLGCRGARTRLRVRGLWLVDLGWNISWMGLGKGQIEIFDLQPGTISSRGGWLHVLGRFHMLELHHMHLPALTRRGKYQLSIRVFLWDKSKIDREVLQVRTSLLESRAGSGRP
jgi:hypothetical protein